MPGRALDYHRPVLSPGRMEALDRALSAAGSEPGEDRDLPRSGRRARGAYFTPRPLCEFVVTEVLGAWLERARPRWRDDGSPELTVLDPAAGDGRFLEAAVDYLTACAAARGVDPVAARAAIAGRTVAGRSSSLRRGSRAKPSSRRTSVMAVGLSSTFVAASSRWMS